GGNDGSSWTDAYTNLHDAIDVAGASDQIWVAAGTYKPSRLPLANTPTAGTGRVTFYLNKALSIYGGFEGTEDPDSFNLKDRAFSSDGTTMAHQTILSGVITSSIRAFHILLANTSETVVLDGFTIRDGSTAASGTDTFEGVSVTRTQ